MNANWQILAAKLKFKFKMIVLVNVYASFRSVCHFEAVSLEITFWEIWNGAASCFVFLKTYLWVFLIELLFQKILVVQGQFNTFEYSPKINVLIFLI